MTLTEFLLARIAEDEAYARARQREDFRRHRVSAHRTHLAPDDPSRVLAECEAKRRIVEHHAPHGDEFVLCAICTEVGPDAQLWPCLTLKLLAAVYADHPDYREEWKP